MTSIINFSKKNFSNKLYCFPYAGGSPAIYYPWSELLPDTIHVAAIQFPGKGSALFDEPYHTMDELVSGAYNALLVDGAFERDYYLFGHSLGAKVVIMLTKEIFDRGGTLPKKIFLSGSASPEEKITRTISKGMTDDEFVSLLRDMNGTPDAVLENKELLSLCLPAIRADFMLSESFFAKAPDRALPVKAVVLYSETDNHVPTEHVYKWQKFIEPKINFIKIDGDHFFVDNNQSMVTDAIKDNL